MNEWSNPTDYNERAYISRPKFQLIYVNKRATDTTELQNELSFDHSVTDEIVFIPDSRQWIEWVFHSICIYNHIDVCNSTYLMVCGKCC